MRRAAALDFGQPAAVMRLGVHPIQDSEDPHDQDQHQKVLAYTAAAALAVNCRA